MGTATLMDAFGALAGFSGRVTNLYSKEMKARQDIAAVAAAAKEAVINSEFSLELEKLENSGLEGESYNEELKRVGDRRDESLTRWREAAEKEYRSPYYKSLLDEIKIKSDAGYATERARRGAEHEKHVTIRQYENGLNGIDAGGKTFDESGVYNSFRLYEKMKLLNGLAATGFVSPEDIARKRLKITADEAARALGEIAETAGSVETLETRLEKFKNEDKAEVEKYGQVPDMDGLIDAARERGTKIIQDRYMEGLTRAQAAFLQAGADGDAGLQKRIAETYAGKNSDLWKRISDEKNKELSPVQKLQALAFFRLPDEKPDKDRRDAAKSALVKVLGGDEQIKNFVALAYNGDFGTMGLDARGLVDAFITWETAKAGLDINEADEYLKNGEITGSVYYKIKEQLKKQMPPDLQRHIDTTVGAYEAAVVKEMSGIKDRNSDEYLAYQKDLASSTAFLLNMINEEAIQDYAQNPDAFLTRLNEFVALSTVKDLRTLMSNTDSVFTKEGVTYFANSNAEKMLRQNLADNQKMLTERLGIDPKSGSGAAMESDFEISADGSDVDPPGVHKVTGAGEKSGWYKIETDADGLEKIRYSKDRGKTWGPPPAGIDERVKAAEIEQRKRIDEWSKKPYDPYNISGGYGTK